MATSMRRIGATGRIERAPGPRTAVRPRLDRDRVVPATVAGAWLVVVVAQASGTAGLLHHHALIEGGPPLPVAVSLFLLGWLVMVAAMMLPASLPAFRLAHGATAPLARPGVARAAFLGAFAGVWTAFGTLAFGGDLIVHRVVDATPWLAAHPWLIETGVLALAGAWQLTPRKRRSLATCRHPEDSPAAVRSAGDALRLGLAHGLACLGSSWALMLLMFAEGFASLPWMVALTCLMVYETTGRHGARAASLAGVALLMGALTLLGGPLPPAA